jgi:multidrug efflux system membrane fusion protein
MKIFVSLISVILVCLSCKQQEQQEQTSTDSINIALLETEAVKQTELTFPINTYGKICAKTETDLSFKTAGIVEKIYVNEGQYVKKGQLLAELNLAEVQAQLNQAKAAMEKADRDFKRMQNLLKDDVITLEDFENTRTSYEIAQSNLEIAQFNYAFSTIKAPTNGKIYKLFTEENEMVSPGTPIFRIGSSESAWIVRSYITDKETMSLQLNDKAIVTTDCYNNHKLDAYVSEIAHAADPQTGMYEVELTFNKCKHKLLSGMFAEVEILPATTSNVLQLPLSALVEANGNTGYVYSISDSNKVEKEEIQIVSIDNQFLYAHYSSAKSLDEVVVEGFNIIQ